MATKTKTTTKCTWELEPGDIILSASGKKFVFQSTRRAKISAKCIETGQNYAVRIPYDDQWTVVGFEKPKVQKNDKDKLTPGALFVINHKNNAMLFKYKSTGRTGKIKAENPLTGGIVNLDATFNVTLIKNIK